jgi:hypothetical protein
MTTTDRAGRWSFAVSALAPVESFDFIPAGVDAFHSPAGFMTQAAVTLAGSGASLVGTVTPAQPGRTVTIQRLRDGKGPAGEPLCVTNAAGIRTCQEMAWIDVAKARLDSAATGFSATVTAPGEYRANLRSDDEPPAGVDRANVYAGRSPEVRL